MLKYIQNGKVLEIPKNATHMILKGDQFDRDGLDEMKKSGIITIPIDIEVSWIVEEEING